MVKLAVLLAILPAPLQAIIPTPCLTSPSSCSGGDPSALRPLPHHPGTYMLTVTGSGAGEAFGVRYLSEDGWTSGPDSFLSPSWSATYLGNPRPAFWAPDLPTTSATTMFYSISSGGMETDDAGTSSLMCIGVATGEPVARCGDSARQMTGPARSRTRFLSSYADTFHITFQGPSTAFETYRG